MSLYKVPEISPLEIGGPTDEVPEWKTSYEISINWQWNIIRLEGELQLYQSNKSPNVQIQDEPVHELMRSYTPSVRRWQVLTPLSPARA